MTAERDTELSAWATTPEMSAMEAMMWRAETDPRLRIAGVIMELLDTTPEWERFVEGHAWALRRVPRLRHRVVDDPTHLGPPAWVESDVNLEHHVQRVTLRTGAGLDDVLRVAEELHMTALDRDRPLWRSVLVEGLPGGRSAYLLKIHHAMADGPAVVQLFDLIHSTRRAPSKNKPELPPLPPVDMDGLDLTATHAKRSVGGALRLAKGAASKGISVARDPGGAVDYAKALRRLAKDVGADPSPLFGEPGLERRLAVIDIPVAELAAAGTAAGGTLNDAYLAGLLGGLARYHAQHGSAVEDLPVAIPLTLRGEPSELEAEAERFAAARIALPAGDMQPERRIELVGARLDAARFEAALDVLGLSSEIISRIPAKVLTKLTLAMTSTVDLQASNFVGLRRDAYLAGAKVERWYAFGPAPGCAITATLVLHGRSGCVGVTIDSDQVSDPDVLVACLRAGFEEVVGSGDQVVAA